MEMSIVSIYSLYHNLSVWSGLKVRWKDKFSLFPCIMEGIKFVGPSCGCREEFQKGDRLKWTL